MLQLHPAAPAAGRASLRRSEAPKCRWNLQKEIPTAATTTLKSVRSLAAGFRVAWQARGCQVADLACNFFVWPAEGPLACSLLCSSRPRQRRREEDVRWCVVLRRLVPFVGAFWEPEPMWQLCAGGAASVSSDAQPDSRMVG